MTLFKANDIRGIYPTDLNEDITYKVGRAFAQFIKSKEVIVARDNRLSSPQLSRALIAGLLDHGVNVIDIGVIDSPGLYFATIKLNKPGIMVTASHNPAEYNGFYLVKANAMPLYEANGLKTIEKIAQKGSFNNTKKKGTLSTHDIMPAYTQYVLSFVNKRALKPLKIVVDATNGVGALIAQHVFPHLPFKIIPLFYELDGSYPNHEPNPAVPENMKQLANSVRKHKADLGIALDGDADRAGFVDNTGAIVEGSLAGTLLAQYLTSEHPHSKIVYSSTCSRILAETVTRAGGTALKERVGHTFIKARMHKEKAILGIEDTGHFMFKANSYADSGIIAALTMCEILSRSRYTLAELAEPLKIYHKATGINFKTKHPDKVMKRIESAFKSRGFTPSDRFDGVTFSLPEGDFKVRASQTEPLVRLTGEGHSKKQVEEKIKKIKKIIDSVLSA